MKLVPVTYHGFTAMDRRFSSVMLPWIVSEIRRRDFNDKLSLGVEDGILQAYNPDFELQFSHRVNQMTRFSQADLDPCTFLYLLRDDNENLLYCYLFHAQKMSDVTDLYKQMKEQSHVTPTRSLSSAANLTSLCVDISPSSSNFFEVLYIGKIKVWQKKVPETFIDDALEKFRVHELEKNKLKQLGNITKLQSDERVLRRGSLDSVNSDTSSVESHTGSPALQRSTTLSQLIQKPTTLDGASSRGSQEKCEKVEETPKVKEKQMSDSYKQLVKKDGTLSESESDITVRDRKENIQNIRSVSESSSLKLRAEESTNVGDFQKSMSNAGASSSSDNESNKDGKEMKSPVDMDDHNRTMVLQVDRTDLRLISPDRKVILLHKHHQDVTTCVQGQEKAEHFGFVCRESSSNPQTFIGYIFKCESPSVASDAVAAITQAFLSAETRPRAAVTSCDHCPMVWFHKLCAEVEHMSDKKTQAAILRRLETLEPEEQMMILTKFRGAETDSVREQNEFLMMLLRAHCEMKQGRHVHDTAENRSEFLNQYLGVGGGNVFSKARKSLSNSFDQLLKRRASKDDIGATLKGMNLPITNSLNREGSPYLSSNSINEDKDSEGFRSRLNSTGSQSELKDSHLSVRNSSKHSSVSPDKGVDTADKGPKSPMMDIFLKVGNSPKSSTSDEDSPNKMDAGSWRQAIFKRVVTPSKQEVEQRTKKRTKEELKELWKKSIRQAILLVRMEKENARLKAEQEESAVKRIKLEYDEMKPNQREVMEVWDLVTNKESRIKCDRQMLLHAIRQGVPRGKRGEVWQFLAEQACRKSAPIDTVKYPNYNLPYETLLKQLTSHQHAILIDLGRTFPNHSYFSSPMGPGQLALFNLLKAYSLLDPEVGYCQGLSFVAGVLLLHMEESQAFYLLRHLMFRSKLRKQYLPDMIGLQVKLYQLSRLVHDQLPDLYNHFDFYEVAPTLYAAPWMLTIFASQFPLGFVTRVFDLIFLEGPDVIFRVALALLTYHKDKLLLCDSFEEIMNFVKTHLPSIEKPMLDKIMKQVFTTDIKKQLEEYKVEYQVLQEEMTSVQPHVEAVHKLEAQNKIITEQNKTLISQLELALSNVQRLEKTRVLQQSQLNKSEMHSRALEVTIATLANFVNSIVEQKVDVEIPEDVQRIMAQISFSERRKSELKPQNNLMRMFQKPERMSPPRVMVKSLSTGKIALPTNIDQSMSRSNSLNTKAQNMIPQDLKTQTQKTPSNSSERKSQFFSNSHSNILQQRINGQNAMLNNKIDIKIQEFENNRKNSLNGKSISLPLKENVLLESHTQLSPCNSVDSGLSTPVSPKNSESTPLSPKNPEAHPLSNCDVNFTYSGTRELKNLKYLRNYTRNSSPDIIGK